MTVVAAFLVGELLFVSVTLGIALGVVVHDHVPPAFRRWRRRWRARRDFPSARARRS